MPVYDLRVKGAHEFFANGVLVHNSVSGGDGAYTAGVLMAKDARGLYYVEDVVRGRWSSGERNRTILETAKLDRLRHGHVEIWVEQEPGSGGKESAEISVREMAGFSVRADRVTGDKVTRFRPFAAQAEGGNVRVVESQWVLEYIDELTSFPAGAYRDQVDATGGAFAKLYGMPVDARVDVPAGRLVDVPNGRF